METQGSHLLTRWLLALCLALAAMQPASARENPAVAVAVSRLPAEAREVLQRIHQGGPFRYAKDGTVFSNREGRLPRHPRGYYHEYTVPTPGARDRGPQRIITGGPGEYWYTGDHYRTFRRILE